MKNTCAIFLLAFTSCYMFGCATVEKVATFNSRIVAYGHFWTEANQNQLKEMYNKAQTAKKDGDTETYNKISGAMQAKQKQIHRQVFSNDKIDNVVADIKDNLAIIAKEAGVDIVVPDNTYDGKTAIDVTDKVVAIFNLNEKQLKTVNQLLKTKPVTLEQAE
ncbi:MAG: hypothetical protein JEZ07_01075 [Phycisphaerae bacterium]|nr:hypothetical protein [Phycisphaerae bacterium]